MKTATKAIKRVHYKNVKYVVSDFTKGSFNSTGTDIYFHVPKEIDFCAYYPYAESSSASVLPGKDGIITVNTDEGNKTTASQKTIDFMYAHATASHSNPTISFTKANMYDDNAFHHMMTCLKVIFKLGEGFEGQSFDKNITIGMNGAKHNGTFNLRRYGWTEPVGEASNIVLFDNSEKQYDVTNETITAEEGAKEVAFTLYLLPQQSKMIFPIQVSYPTSNDPKVVEYVGTIYRNLESGKKYTYNINLNKKALTVEEASIVDWENKTPGKNDAEMQTEK